MGNLLIVLVAGSLAALVAARGDFRDPTPLAQADWRLLFYSGWVHLAGIGLLAVSLLVANGFGGATTRRFQFAIVLSVLAHLTLAAFLYAHYLPAFDPRFQETKRLAFDNPEQSTLPDYHWQHVDVPESQSDFSRPVPSEPPAPVEVPWPVFRSPDHAIREEKLLRPEREEIPRPVPEVVRPRRAELPGPPRDEHSAVIPVGRQDIGASLDLLLKVPEPAIPPSASDGTQEVRPSQAEVGRRSEGTLPAMAPANPLRPDSPFLVRAALPERRAAGPQTAFDMAEGARIARQSPGRTVLPDQAGSAVEVPAGARGADPPQGLQPQEASLSRRPDVLPSVESRGEMPLEHQPGVLPIPLGLKRLRLGHDAALGPVGQAGFVARAAPGATLLPGAVEDGLVDAATRDRQQRPGPQAEGAGEVAGEERWARGREPSLAGPDVQSASPRIPLLAATQPGPLTPTPVIGSSVPTRLGLPESAISDRTASAARLARPIGRLPIDGRVPEPQEAFRQRSPEERRRRAEAFGSSPETEQAVQRGVDFLARHQFPDGHWSLDRVPQGNRGDYEKRFAPGQMSADTAATGLALLAFLGAGYTHLEGKYQAVVRQGVDWLLRNQNPEGSLFRPETDASKPAQFYGHAIATIALCEALGMTSDPELRGPTQRAIQYILRSQHPEQGGWRYEPRSESDTSVSGWKLMALRSAQMAGLEVPQEAFARASHWLDLAQVDGGARYVYNPFAADTEAQRAGRRPNPAMTAEGLLMRMYSGWDRTHPALIRGVGYLLENLPTEHDPGPTPPDRFYYWYYATQVMFQMQGEPWDQWNRHLRPLLERTQVLEGPLAGSWDPRGTLRDRWAPFGGRLYATTLSLLMLEVYYRHLPLYQPLEK